MFDAIVHSGAGLNQFSLQLSGLFDDTRVDKTVRTPYDGVFAGSMPSGDYQVDLALPPGCCYVKEMAYSGVPFTDNHLQLPPGIGGTLRIVLAAGAATLHCTAVDGDGKPIERASYVLIPEGAATQPEQEAMRQISTASEFGTSRPWQNLAPGKYRVVAVNRPLDLGEDLERIWRVLSQATPVELGPNVTLEVRLTAIALE